jgi:two-component system NtrC family sensor kinase
MKKIVYILCLLTFPVGLSAQNINLDSLIKVVAKQNRNKINDVPLNKDDLFRRFIIAKPGAERIKIIYELMEDQHTDSKQIVKTAYKFLKWTTDHNDLISEAVICAELAAILGENGDKDIALKLEGEALSAAKKSDDWQALGIVYVNLSQRSDIPRRQAMGFALKAIKFSGDAHDGIRISWAYVMLVYYYRDINKPDSVKYYAIKGLDIALKANSINDIIINLSILGKLTKNDNTELKYLKAGQKISELGNDYIARVSSGSDLSEYFWYRNEIDSALVYAKKAYEAGRNFSLSRIEFPVEMLGDLYTKKRNIDSAIKYIRLSYEIQEVLYNNASIVRAQAVTFAEQQKQQQVAVQKAAAKNILRFYMLIVVITFLAVITFILAKNNKKNRAANQLLARQKEKIEFTLVELRSTQSQLIQSEKMASLGELTAGIAHEIQNPLNFVNNFSEVSMELIDEMQEELNKGDKEEAIAIAGDLKENLEKIIHHGKRADGIVKGMLQHSRASSTVKEPTDINKLADEYFRLAYHGLRAKDKTFNAELETHFDETLPLVNVVPQDIGRVLLNLFNNAFYAVQQKQKNSAETYKPAVVVSTAVKNNQIIISVKDNGNGIPDAVKDKVMQPFFTTKPTGEGTGLGLSLSYDIVRKGHGGDIKIDSKEGEGSEFMVTLPIS